jgi:hypothetical protein
MIIRRYNPIYMKPTQMEPYVPWNLPIYWGPDPAAGISYGAYQNSAKSTIVTKKQDKVFCPINGQPMEYLGDIVEVDFEATKAAIIGEPKSCACCGEKSYANFDVSDDLHCWNCGNLFQGENKTMSKIKEIRKAMEAKLATASDDSQEFVNLDELLVQLDEESKVQPEEAAPTEESPAAEEAPVDEPKAEETPAEEPKTEAPADEPKAEEAPAPAEEPAAEEPKAEEAPAPAEDAPKAEGEGEEIESLEKVMHPDAAEEVATEVVEVAEDAAEEAAEETAEEVATEVGEEITEKLQDQIDDLKEETGTDPETNEEMVDLDIVLSMLNGTAVAEEEMIDLEEVIKMAEKESGKPSTDASEEEACMDNVEATANTLNVNVKEEDLMKTDKQKTIARIRAKSRARFLKKRVQAELEAKKATAESESAPIIEPKPVTAPNAKEHKDMEVPSKDIKEATESAPSAEELAAPRSIEGEKLMDKEMEPSEALRYESLSSVEALASISKDDVELVLFGDKSENPTWIAFAHATPVAKIELASQENADSIRAVFASTDYANDLITHIADIGMVECLKKVNASFFANHISDKAIASRYESAAAEKVSQFKAQAETKLRSDLLSALDVITVAMNKNLYQDVGHPLKEALFETMVLAGMPENTAASAIDSAFAAAASPYYQVVFEKALAFMNMSDTSKSEIKNMISESNVAAADVSNNEPATLGERLGRASSVASLQNYGGPSLKVQAAVEIDKDAYKARLKNVIKK